MEILMRAMRQQPDEMKIRKSRWAIIRNTYPELKSTTIKTFQEWIPDNIAPVVFSIPITAKFRQKLADGTFVDLEFVFMALDSPEDVSKLLSMELTGAYLNEGREIAWEIIEGLIGRVPRYPKTIKEDVLDEAGNPVLDAKGKVVQKTIYGPTEPGILIDSNPPPVTHWLYTKFETGAVPEGWRKFQQPPAVYKDPTTDKWVLNPDAENLSHLDDNYYQRILNAATEEYIRINLAGEFGMSRKGKPVFSKYSEHKHVSKEVLIPMRGYPVIIGQDFGLTPAIVLGQLTNRGFRVTDELPATDETLEDFLDEYLSPLLLARYQGFSVVACGDPTGGNRSSLAAKGKTSYTILRSRNIKAYPAFTNDIGLRIGTVNYFLGRDEGLIISPHCTHLREAMGAGYIFKETKNKSGQILDTPDKNEYSHIADALQYALLFARYGNRQIGTKVHDKKQEKPHLYA
ncbi:MAG: hypothetical protein V4649_19365 [Bacteroidota bacterium]